MLAVVISIVDGGAPAYVDGAYGLEEQVRREDDGKKKKSRVIIHHAIAGEMYYEAIAAMRLVVLKVFIYAPLGGRAMYSESSSRVVSRVR